MVMCDRKMPVKCKDKVFKTIIRPAMAYGYGCRAVKYERCEQTKFSRNEDVEMDKREDQFGVYGVTNEKCNS